MSMYPAAPSAQLAAVQALSQALVGIRVSTKIPDPRPEEHVVVSRIGGQRPEFGTAMPRFLIEVYGQNDLSTERLAETVHAAWMNLRTHGINYSTSDWNLLPFDAPDQKHVRFQFTGGLQILL